MKRVHILLTIIIMIIVLLCGCQEEKPYISMEPTPIPTPTLYISPEPTVQLCFNSYEEFAQSIIDGWFFKHGSDKFMQYKNPASGYHPDAELDAVIKEKMAATSVIKPLVNGEELGWYADVNEDYKGNYLMVYYPYEDSPDQRAQGYTAYHLFQDNRLLFWVVYSFDVVSNEDFPKNEKANYDAVINGQNVCIEYSQDSTGRCFGVFQYKDMYEVNIVTENKKQFDIVFSNLTIEEIRVK